MDRCSSSSCHGNGMGSCSCGPFHGQGSSFSILFAAAAGNKPNDGTDEEDPFASSSVDCTLSLGTPSTRQTEAMYQNPRPTSSSYMSNLCWDIFQSKQTPSATTHKSGRSGSGGGDSQLVRRCANCDTTSTPLWRNGPRGPKSLCNACGIRYKKEERRATNNTTAVEAHHLMGHHHHHHHHHPWSYAGQAPKTVPTSVNGEFRLIEGDDDDGESSSPYLSWRLNVPPPDFPVHMT